MKKRFLFLVLTLALALSCITPAFAAESSGNGYHVRDIIYNGKTYEAVLAASFKADKGAACTIITCRACVKFTQKKVTAVFDTKNYGYISAISASQTKKFTEQQSTFESPYATCSKGASQVITYRDINGGAIVYGNNDTPYQLNAHLIHN